MTRPCSTCPNPIPERRLLAVPDATRCVSCQEAHDVTIRVSADLLGECADIKRQMGGDWR